MLGEGYLAVPFPVFGTTQVDVLEPTSTLGASHFVSVRAVRTVPRVMLL